MKLTTFQRDIAVSVAGRVDQDISDYVCSKPKWQMKTAFEIKMLSDWKIANEKRRSRPVANNENVEYMSEMEFYDHTVREFVFGFSYPIATNVVGQRLQADAVFDKTLESEEELLVEICLELVGAKINNIERPRENIIDRFLKRFGYTRRWPMLFRETRPVEEIGLYWMNSRQGNCN
jgi:hypothetical protein